MPKGIATAAAESSVPGAVAHQLGNRLAGIIVAAEIRSEGVELMQSASITSNVTLVV